jgi:hypothetical protein
MGSFPFLVLGEGVRTTGNAATIQNEIYRIQNVVIGRVGNVAHPVGDGLKKSAPVVLRQHCSGLLD